MKSLQKHTHSGYCHRNKSCHFGFPKSPASRTVISCQPSEEDKADDIIRYAEDVLQKVQNVLSSIQIANEDLAIADLLQKVWIDLDTYMQALQISQKGHRIILQWNSCDIFIMHVMEMYFISGEEILISTLWKMNIAQLCMSADTWWKVEKQWGKHWKE